jgi:hypothetical protein
MAGHREREQSSASFWYGTFEQYLGAQQQQAWLFQHTLCSVRFQDLVDAIKEWRAMCGTASWRIMADSNESEQ